MSVSPSTTVLIFVQSSLPIPPFLGLEKKQRYSETAVLGRSITFKKPYLGVEMGSGIGREAVLGFGRGRIGRNDCSTLKLTKFLSMNFLYPSGSFCDMSSSIFHTLSASFMTPSLLLRKSILWCKVQ